MPVRNRLRGFRLQVSRFADEQINVLREPESVHAKARVHYKREALTAFFDAAICDQNGFPVDFELAFGFQFPDRATANAELFEPFGQKLDRIVFLDSITPRFG
jgi:hypothetical protein